MGDGSAHRIRCLLVIGHRAKFVSSRPNNLNVEIAAVAKIWSFGVTRRLL